MLAVIKWKILRILKNFIIISLCILIGGKNDMLRKDLWTPVSATIAFL